MTLASNARWEQFRKLEKLRDEQWLQKMHNLSAQYLFNADVADKSLSFIRVRLIMGLCFRHRPLLREEIKRAKEPRNEGGKS